MIKKDVFDDEDIPLLIFYVVCFFYKLIVANSQQNIILVSVSFLSTGGEIDNRGSVWRGNTRTPEIK
jgi:type IV secretory pathway VirB3-like protein